MARETIGQIPEFTVDAPGSPQERVSEEVKEPVEETPQEEEKETQEPPAEKPGEEKTPTEDTPPAQVNIQDGVS